ncbi:murein L,D-transpeptidase [Variovorax sp. EBFNA2]|uniref:murein L,D-transpeptidase n=1 Tax=Variovorax sp. EBFNA2 TaxID=3342097 RepID=UPI0029C06F4F|nr:murein L,D-transpeptidase [Variovorax boronicumulans]WPG40907.1 murein L,D-transpeptidase [Variovorax boronicumulans]
MTRVASLIATLAIALATLSAVGALAGPASPSELAEAFRARVEHRLDPPPDEARRYGELALGALAQAGIAPTAQYVALVDRSPNVQAIFIYWLNDGAAPLLIGAAAASTGRGGEFDHFETPLGVFEHSTANPDFRAEGTRNKSGIRGYGAKGLRVFDLGWQQARRLWGQGGTGTMRLQMHATDPDLLEPRLGSVQSKGCIGIPASLNRLLDHFGVLDADYIAAAAQGLPMWMLPADHTPIASPGRYLVVVDSVRAERPAWSPAPGPRRTSAPAGGK